jgi:hypothetical protein
MKKAPAIGGGLFYFNIKTTQAEFYLKNLARGNVFLFRLITAFNPFSIAYTLSRGSSSLRATDRSQ